MSSNLDDDGDDHYVLESCSSVSDSSYMEDFLPIALVVHNISEEQSVQENPIQEQSVQDQPIQENYVPDQPIQEQSVQEQPFQEQYLQQQQPISKKKKQKDKIHMCVFCGVGQTKLKRHLIAKHYAEKGMFLFLSSSGQQKKKEFMKLRNAGDHCHNLKILKEKKGTLVVQRQKKGSSNNDFVPCPNCLGYFLKKDLFRHKCPCDGEGKRKKKSVKEGRHLLPLDDDDDLTKLISGFRDDNISTLITEDELLMSLGRHEYLRNGNDKDRHVYIRNQLRETGRLLLALKEKVDPNASLDKFIDPKYYKDIVKATRELTGFKSGVCKVPSLAKKIGGNISKCCTILKAEAIAKNDQELKTRCDDFQELHSIRWKIDISSTVSRTLIENKKNNSKDLPLLEDISKLSNHLKTESQNIRNQIQKEITEEKSKSPMMLHCNWVRLAELTLTTIILFNRKRQGEVSKMKVSEYTDGKANRHNRDILSELSQFEQDLCKTLSRIEITGKRGRTVPIILTEEVKKSTEMLMSLRNQAGVHSDNPYFFARNNGSMCHIRGSDTLRKFTEEIPLTNPSLLRSTQLRKQIATMTQVLNLTNNELDIVAQYMGHDVNIHREYYRLPTSTLQVAKVSKILMSLDRGEVPENINSGDLPNEDVSNEQDTEEGEVPENINAGDLLNEDVSNQQDTEDIQGDYQGELSTEGATKMFSIHVDEKDPRQNMSLHSNKGKVYT